MVPLGIPHSEFLSWSEDDQDKALAFLQAKASVCQSCGTRKEEWEADKDAYIGDMDRCRGCQLIEQERENIASLPEGPAGVRVFLRRNTPGVITNDEV